MAESDTDTKLDEIEQSNLQTMISQVEAALAGSTPSARGLMEKFLHNAKARVGMLEKKIKESQAERKTRSRDDAATAALVAKETALTIEERKVYGGFLEKEYFTKHDFADLERFYTHSWDRLSEGGKDEMSHRVWEGIRRDEYTFAELPKVTQEKEIEHAYKRLRDSRISSAEIQQIPEADRADFLRAYEAGNHAETVITLERDSFKRSMFSGAESKRIEHRNVERGNESVGNALGTKIREDASPIKSANKVTDDDDFSAVSKKVGNISEVLVEPSSANIPNAKTAQSGRNNSVFG